jgi:hypothetical protein
MIQTIAQFDFLETIARIHRHVDARRENFRVLRQKCSLDRISRRTLHRLDIRNGECFVESLDDRVVFGRCLVMART